MAIQQLFEHMEWVGLAGDALAYAGHVRKAPLAGVPTKSVTIQFAKAILDHPEPQRARYCARVISRIGPRSSATTCSSRKPHRAEGPAPLPDALHTRLAGPADCPRRAAADRHLLRLGRHRGHPPGTGEVLRGTHRAATAGGLQLHPVGGGHGRRWSSRLIWPTAASGPNGTNSGERLGLLLDVCFINPLPVLRGFPWERHAQAWLLEPGWSPAFPEEDTGLGLTKWTSRGATPCTSSG